MRKVWLKMKILFLVVIFACRRETVNGSKSDPKQCFTQATCSTLSVVTNETIQVFPPMTTDSGCKPGLKGESGRIGKAGPRGKTGARGEKGEVGEINKVFVKNIVEVFCPLHYKNKCYLIALPKPKLDHDGRSALCAKFGGKVANIYDRTHLNLVMDYARQFKMNHEIGYIEFSTGMHYSRSTGVQFRDKNGRPSDLPWIPTWPRPERSSATQVAINVHPDKSATWQYLFHQLPSTRTNVLCEI